MNDHRGPSWWRTGAMVLFSLPFLIPFIFLLSVTFETQRSYVRNPLAIPDGLTLSNLSSAWSAAHLGRAMVNSLLVTTTTTILTLAVCAPAAYWFSRRASRKAQLFLTLLVGAWVIPYVIYLIPLYVLFSQQGLTNNLYTLAVFYAATNVPFGVYLLASYMRLGVPHEVREAARVDGAGAVREFWGVVVPLSRPALATVGALTFIGTWGDLLTAVIMLPDQSKWTLPVAAASLVTQQSANVQQTAGAAVISTLPLLLVFILTQGALIRGITAGAGK